MSGAGEGFRPGLRLLETAGDGGVARSMLVTLKSERWSVSLLFGNSASEKSNFAKSVEIKVCHQKYINICLDRDDEGEAR